MKERTSWSKTFLYAVAGVCIPLCGAKICEAETLTSPQSFRLFLPPFIHAEVAANAPIPVVGTTTRDGKTYRLVKLPDAAASALVFLIADDGSFEGSAINNGGSKMGFSYHPKPNVRLVAMEERVQAPIQDVSDASNSPPPQRLELCVTPMFAVITPMKAENYMLGSAQSGNEIVDAQRAMAQCTDDRVKAAVESAGGNAELKEAIKTFYVKQKAYIAALLPQGEQSKVTFREALLNAQAARAEAWNRVELEMKLAN